MPDKFKNKYRIPSTRLQNWDYGQPAAYFVTICTQGRKCYFGKVINKKMNLSKIGIIAEILWHEIKKHAPDIELGEFVVMPNHVHGILILHGNNDNGNDNNDDNNDVIAQSQQSPKSPNFPNPPNSEQSEKFEHQTIGQKRFQNQGKNTLSSIIGSYKSAVSKYAHRLEFGFAWQSRFYEHIIRNKQSYQIISKYILNNPAKWNDDTFNLTNKITKERPESPKIS